MVRVRVRFRDRVRVKTRVGVGVGVRARVIGSAKPSSPVAVGLAGWLGLGWGR